MKPTISLIISTYNRSHLIKKAIDSVYLKTFDEIIIIDDCSSSWNQIQLKTLLKNYPKIILLTNEENLRMSESKNIAISVAKSQWIIFLDDDDYFITESTGIDIAERLKLFISKHPEADIITHKIINYNTSTQDISLYGDETFTLEELRQNNIITGTSLFKKSVWESVGGLKTIPFPDWEFWIRAKEKDFKFVFFPEIFYCRIESPQGMGKTDLLSLKSIEDWRKQWSGKEIKYSNYNISRASSQMDSNSPDKKLIVQLARVPCANAGYELSKFLNAYSKKYKSIYILGKEYTDQPIAPFRKFPCEYFWRTQKEKCLEIIKKADIIHVHHDWDFPEIEPYLKNKIIVTTFYDIFNSTNQSFLDRVIKYSTLLTVSDQPIQKKVYGKLTKYTLPMVKFLFNERTTKNNPRLLVVFAPTIKQLKGICTKNREDVIAIIEKLKQKLDFDFDLIEGIPYEENLIRKSKADLIIDDTNTEYEEYHCTALEGAYFGAAVLTSYSGKDYPFIKTNLNTLEETLRFYLTHPKELKIAQQNIIKWTKTDYTPEKLLIPYEQLYDDLLNPEKRKEFVKVKEIVIAPTDSFSIIQLLLKNNIAVCLLETTCYDYIKNKILSDQLVLGVSNIEKAKKLLGNNDLVILKEYPQQIKNTCFQGLNFQVPCPVVAYLEKLYGNKIRDELNRRN